MELTIYTYGHIDSMYYVLNGISMIMNSDFTDMLIKATAMIATCYYCFKAAYAGSSGTSKHNLIQIAGIVMAINSLLIPKTTMLIQDHVTAKRDKVDNIPYGFAIPIGFMEKFGDILTASFEQAFTAVGSSNYRDYGMVFGARLIQQARNWRIKSPEFIHNIDNFIQRCMIIDSAIAHKYTMNDLFESHDIWELISPRASKQLRRVQMKIGNNNELLTCKEAIDNVMNPAFVNEINKIKDQYKNTEYGLAGNNTGTHTPRSAANPNNFFKRNLERIFTEYLGNSHSAEANLRQYMILNAMSDYSRNYGFARASMMQDTNWQIAGDLASIYLPILLSVIKGLVYASFIFMVPLMLLGNGGTKYMNYIAVVASLQLWPSLNSILNMFIDLYSGLQMKDIVDGGVSFTSYTKLSNYSDKIVAVSSGLQMMIPFLAFNIIKGGVSGFIHLASNITSASSSASSIAAGEVTTGNKSFDNYSSGNMQIAMQQGFKTDWNISYKAGASEMQRGDGSIEKTLQNGHVIDIRGPGLDVSAGTNKIMLNDETSSQLHKSYSNNRSYREFIEMQKAEAERVLDGLQHQYTENTNKHVSAQIDYNFSELGSDDVSFRDALNHTKNLNSNFEYAHKQSNLWQSAAGIGIEKSIGIIGGISGNLRAEFAIDNSNTQSLSEHIIDSRITDWSNDKRVSIQAAKNDDFNEGASINKDLLENINTVQEKIHEYNRNISHSLAREEQLQRQIAHVSTINSGYNIDITHEVKKQLMDRFDMSPQAADYLINNQASATKENRKKLQMAKDSVVEHYLNNSENYLDIERAIGKKESQLAEDATVQLYSFESQNIEEGKNYAIHGQEKIKQKGDNAGVKKEDTMEKLQIVERAIQFHHKELYDGVAEVIEDGKQRSATKMQDVQKSIDAIDNKRLVGTKK